MVKESIIKDIKSAEFICSYSKFSDCPKSNFPEFAFVGRSNVGKSSLINGITNIKKLAKTSSIPGKTQLINYFLINKAWYLVDLPGIGYAKVSKKKRETFNKLILEYLLKRDALSCVFMLVDSRIKIQKNDLNLINWMGENKIPFALVFTKIDKLSKDKLKTNELKYKKELMRYWEELPPFFTTSSKKKIGIKKMLQFIQSVI